MDFDVTGDATSVYYLNVVGQYGSNTPWLVQNLPLFPQTTVSGTLGLCVDIDLTDFGLSSGTQISSFDFGYQLTTSPLDAAPSVNFSNVSVSSLTYRAPTIDGVNVFRGPFGSPGGFKAAGADSTVKGEPVVHEGVPRVVEDCCQCMPGAFARSLGWLNEKHKLGYGKDAQDIYKELKDRIGFEKRLREEERIKKKAEYAKGISSSIATKVLDAAGVLGSIEGVPEDSTTDLIEWLKREIKTEDVELAYCWFNPNKPPGEQKGCHIVTIAGFWEQDDKSFVYYRDDAVQDGQSGDLGYKIAELEKAADGSYRFKRSSGSTGTIRTVKYAVSESVIPEPVFFQLGALAGLGGLGMLRMRRRG
jgi:hypothetical protein